MDSDDAKSVARRFRRHGRERGSEKDSTFFYFLIAAVNLEASAAGLFYDRSHGKSRPKNSGQSPFQITRSIQAWWLSWSNKHSRTWAFLPARQREIERNIPPSSIKLMMTNHCTIRPWLHQKEEEEEATQPDDIHFLFIQMTRIIGRDTVVVVM